MFICKYVKNGVKGKLETYYYESIASKRWKTISFNRDDMETIKSKLVNKIEKPSCLFSDYEHRLVKRIRTETETWNRNNVTRTEAYLNMYRKHPELHWSFLAHMVSRNGGWCMTDLKGDLLSRLLGETEQQRFFEFFERANALIFQDAYPQLLLYEASKIHQKNLFSLLPMFYVSRFMKPFWDLFLEKQESPLLTIALIVNEQHYVEQRVIQHEYFQKYVFETLKFKIQELFQLTQVVFPYYPKGKDKLRLAGVTVDDFTNILERIEVGKILYGTLFGLQNVYRGAYRFATNKPHSGSRSDVWPHVYSKKRQPNHSYKDERLIGCQLKKNAPPLYSPVLEEGWPDSPFKQPQRYDWFRDSDDVFRYFQQFSTPTSFEMTYPFCFGLNKVELAVIAKEHVW